MLDLGDYIHDVREGVDPGTLAGIDDGPCGGDVDGAVFAAREKVVLLAEFQGAHLPLGFAVVDLESTIFEAPHAPEASW